MARVRQRREFKDEPWYETLVTTVTWIELLSGGGSVLADKMLKISCKNLVNEFNSLPQWPDEFILALRGAEARSILTKISGVSVELLSAANKRIRNILDELWKRENKLAFSKSTLNGSILHTDVDISEIIRIGYLAKLPRWRTRAACEI
ncbi:hypothetical protein [Pedobacter sp. GR22-10]|uniref:hypothetical protein n=1 Tax=Pedobacter sp. GR22-10 TaxID=2994472 RepID=UPI002244FCBD|nr:hypothetical protein [Pedobacter sp. GR22-10]MCX2431038.1 hypothetical protein [Pedobacter sp. GR22-10]